MQQVGTVIATMNAMNQVARTNESAQKPTSLPGLSAAEVAERIRAGQVNRTPRSELRDYAQIVGRNLFNWFNAMVVPASIALFVLGDYQAGIAVSGMAIVNTTLSLAQEIRAKRHLDKLAILVQSQARVVRAGQVQSIPGDDIVLGDTILVETGETILADGTVLDAQFLEIDEALLTGESDPVRRQNGERLLSGSVCVAGQGAYRAEQVGSGAFANQTSAQARSYRFVASPMTQVINRIVQVLSYTAVALLLLYTIAYVADDVRTEEDRLAFVRRIAATITSMVPQGLVLTATVAFTLGAVYMSRRGAVVQRLNAVEAMAAIDIICTDKTGTLTTNRLHLEDVIAASREPALDTIKDWLRRFASASTDKNNKSIQALRAALGTTDVDLLDQIPFKSQNRYSAVRIRAEESESLLVLGALEALRGRMPSKLDGLEQTAHEKQQAGQRVLLFARGTAATPFPTEEPKLPDVSLEPLALVIFGDELRPDAADVLKALHDQGIAFKILSGDNPETVRATVGHLPLPMAHEPILSGKELADAGNDPEMIRQHSVFGRVAPEQKVAIIEALKSQGSHVAMIGDGVNDVLPIKRADLGIAMGEGSQASKTVAGLVLENNNFALLPETLAEGRMIVRNLRRSGKLFLVKNVYSLIFILAYLGGAGIPFPYIPQQVTLLNWLVIGIPAFVIAVSRQRSTSATRPRFLREVGWFAVRTGVLFAAAGLTMLLLVREYSEEHQRTMLLSTLILLGITALFRALTDGEDKPLRGDTRFRLLALFSLPVYALAMYWPLAARFFKLTPLGVGDWLWVAGVTAIAYLLTLASDRLQWPSTMGARSASQRSTLI